MPIEPSDALQVAQNMLRKMQLLIDEGLSDKWDRKLGSIKQGDTRSFKVTIFSA